MRRVRRGCARPAAWICPVPHALSACSAGGSWFARREQIAAGACKATRVEHAAPAERAVHAATAGLWRRWKWNALPAPRLETSSRLRRPLPLPPLPRPPQQPQRLQRCQLPPLQTPPCPLPSRSRLRQASRQQRSSPPAAAAALLRRPTRRSLAPMWRTCRRARWRVTWWSASRTRPACWSRCSPAPRPPGTCLLCMLCLLCVLRCAARASCWGPAAGQGPLGLGAAAGRGARWQLTCGLECWM